MTTNYEEKLQDMLKGFCSSVKWSKYCQSQVSLLSIPGMLHSGTPTMESNIQRSVALHRAAGVYHRVM